MSFIYLASPYSDPDPAVRGARFHAAQAATAWLFRQRLWAFSPVVHCHHLAFAYDLPTEAAFWQDYDFSMLDRARELMILTIPGWSESDGVRAEGEYALAHHIPVKFLSVYPYIIQESP